MANRPDEGLTASVAPQTAPLWQDVRYDGPHLAKGANTQPHRIVYPTQILAQFGYKIDACEGPVSQAELYADVSEQKLGKPMCYWRP